MIGDQRLWVSHYASNSIPQLKYDMLPDATDGERVVVYENQSIGSAGSDDGADEAIEVTDATIMTSEQRRRPIACISSLSEHVLVRCSLEFSISFQFRTIKRPLAKWHHRRR